MDIKRMVAFVLTLLLLSFAVVALGECQSTPCGESESYVEPGRSAVPTCPMISWEEQRSGAYSYGYTNRAPETVSYSTSSDSECAASGTCDTPVSSPSSGACTSSGSCTSANTCSAPGTCASANTCGTSGTCTSKSTCTTNNCGTSSTTSQASRYQSQSYGAGRSYPSYNTYYSTFRWWR